MKYLSFLLYTIMFIAIVTPVAVVIFDFYDIKIEVYGNYLFWFIAMALFNALLPGETKNIFDEVKSVPQVVGSAINKVRTSVQTFSVKNQAQADKLVNQLVTQNIVPGFKSVRI